MSQSAFAFPFKNLARLSPFVDARLGAKQQFLVGRTIPNLVGLIGLGTLTAQFTAEYIHKLFQGPPFQLSVGG